MAVPKRKQSPSRTGMRRAQSMKISSKNVVEDKKSGEYRLSHHLDPKTGMYRGRQILDPKE
jgi:large subunit ribosomal protein L32